MILSRSLISEKFLEPIEHVACAWLSHAQCSSEGMVFSLSIMERGLDDGWKGDRFNPLIFTISPMRQTSVTISPPGLIYNLSKPRILPTLLKLVVLLLPLRLCRLKSEVDCALRASLRAVILKSCSGLEEPLRCLL